MTAHSPAGRLLEAARRRLGISQNEAARRAGVSGTTWRNVIRGYAEHGGSRVPYPGSPDTVARFAHVVGVLPDELEAAGRPDAAQALRAVGQEGAGGQHSATEALLVGSEEVIAEIEVILERRGVHLDRRRRRVVGRFAAHMLETLAELDGEEHDTAS